MRADSSGPMPAIGSSSSSMRGPRRQRHGDLELAVLAVAQVGDDRIGAVGEADAGERGARGLAQLGLAARVAPEAEGVAGMRLHGERHVVERREVEEQRGDLERAREPQRRCAARPAARVMSRPSKRMRPASGAISPVSWPISVVLPAPFGPMMACSSPRGTSSAMSSEATTPPKRLLRPSICSSGSGTAQPRQQCRRCRRARTARPAAAWARGSICQYSRGRATSLAREGPGDQADQPGQRLLQQQQRQRRRSAGRTPSPCRPARP